MFQGLLYSSSAAKDAREICQCQGCLSRQIHLSRHMSPTPPRHKKAHYMGGNPYFLSPRAAVLLVFIVSLFLYVEIAQFNCIFS